MPLPPLELELYKRCDEVLHYVWDPIGISDVPEARDEYESYLPTVWRLVITLRREIRLNQIGASGKTFSILCFTGGTVRR